MSLGCLLQPPEVPVWESFKLPEEFRLFQPTHEEKAPVSQSLQEGGSLAPISTSEQIQMA